MDGLDGVSGNGMHGGGGFGGNNGENGNNGDTGGENGEAGDFGNNSNSNNNNGDSFGDGLDSISGSDVAAGFASGFGANNTSENNESGTESTGQSGGFSQSVGTSTTQSVQTSTFQSAQPVQAPTTQIEDQSPVTTVEIDFDDRFSVFDEQERSIGYGVFGPVAGMHSVTGFGPTTDVDGVVVGSSVISSNTLDLMDNVQNKVGVVKNNLNMVESLLLNSLSEFALGHAGRIAGSFAGSRIGGPTGAVRGAAIGGKIGQEVGRTVGTFTSDIIEHFNPSIEFEVDDFDFDSDDRR